MTEKAHAVLDNLVGTITGDTVCRYVRQRLFSDGVNIPCQEWSYLNQYMTFLAGTTDARGIKQWNQAGRRVKKGSHAFYILVPMLYPKKKGEDNGKGNGEPANKKLPKEDTDNSEKTLTGFKLMPVFRLEDTEGVPLDYEITLKAFDVNSLPLIEVAKALGVEVKAGLTKRCEGSYSPHLKWITLGTDDPQVFLHELSHAIDYALPNRKGDYAFGEVIAELSAAFLGSLYGVPVNITNTKAYIEGWAGKSHVVFKVMEALKRVEEIYHYIEYTTPPQKQKKARRTAKTGNLSLERRPKSPTAKAIEGEESLFNALSGNKTGNYHQLRLVRPKKLLSNQKSPPAEPHIIEFPSVLRIW